MNDKRRAAIFIGSSVEGLDVAYAIQENLEFDAEPTVWSQGIFAPSHTALTDLVRAAAATDIAILTLTPDDVRLVRGRPVSTPRDNLIFELGLFIGALGIERVFFVVPQGQMDLHLPTDLLGVTPLTYVADRSDRNLLAALEPSCNRLRRAIHSLDLHPRPPDDLAQEFIDVWDGPVLAAARQVLRTGIPANASEDETGEATIAMRHVFSFLNSLADAVLSERISEARARLVFEGPIHTVLRSATTFLAPPNHVDDWWRPLPRIAELDQRWRGAS